MAKVCKVGLCAARHEMPVSEFIYPQVISDPTDIESLRKTAFEFIKAKALEGYRSFEVYVTGMTVALTSFLAEALAFPGGDVDVTLYHYDVKSGSYYPQKMW